MKRFTLTGLIVCLFVVAGSYAFCQTSDLCKGAQCKTPPKRIQINAKIEIKYPAKCKGKCKDESSSPIITTIENHIALISVSGFVPSISDKKKLVSNKTSISVRPVITADGHIDITGTLTQDGECFSVKGAKFSASFESGKSQKLPIIEIPANKGKDKATAELILTAVVLPN